MRAIATTALRALVIALLVPLACSAGLPAIARALGGPTVHVCRCDARRGHAECACPICHPDRDELAFSQEAIRGKCGDDDVAFGGALDGGVIPPALAEVLPAPLVARLRRGAAEPRAPDWTRAPPSPPPRSLV